MRENDNWPKLVYDKQNHELWQSLTPMLWGPTTINVSTIREIRQESGITQIQVQGDCHQNR